jgi:8-oxo-dGTP pyrophosphatase MutT (NUDIX family)
VITDAKSRFDLRGWCDGIVHEYLRRYPAEDVNLTPLRAALASDADLASRQTTPLHLTASSVVLDTEGTHLLLLFHRKLGIWVQPGGHLGAREYPPEAAARELAEECHLSGAQPEFRQGLPFDTDIHPIEAHPAKGEPAHWHCDFRYTFRSPRAPILLSRESLRAHWARRGRELEELTQGRMARITSKLDDLHPLRSDGRPTPKTPNR